MFQSFIDSLFGCSHRRTTFPLTPGRKKGHIEVKSVDDMRRGTYVVCLDCGKEFNYNWDNMKVGEPLQQIVRRTTPQQVQEAID